MIIAFNFKNKSCHPVSITDIDKELSAGNFLWLDMDYAVEEQAHQLSSLNLIQPETIDNILQAKTEVRLSRHDNYLHLVVSGCDINDDHKFSEQRLDLVVYENFILTAHSGDHYVLNTIKEEYKGDFERFAQTSSYLIFEFWDALIEHYANVQKHLELQVEKIQHKLVNVVDDKIFQQVSLIGENLLHFRGILMPVRTLLNELISRHSHLLSEATRISLGNIAGNLEQVLQDVLVDRDILTQTVNLHMSMVSHKTNQAMSKLTVISVIFLPLTFLCGVYGMNFQFFPELHWHYGYAFFWLLCAGIIFALVFLLRRNRLL